MILITSLFGLGAAASAALISGAASAAGSGLSAAATGAKNRKQRRWQNEDWHKRSKQYWDAWTANNNYNHPREQMKRFREAGLNPNLIYGQGNSGPASNSSFPSESTSNFEPLVTEAGGQNLFGGFGNAAQHMLSYTHQKAITDNVNANTEKTRVDKDQALFDLVLKHKYGDEQMKTRVANAILDNKLKEITNTREIGKDSYYRTLGKAQYVEGGKDITAGRNIAKETSQAKQAAIAEIRANTSNKAAQNERIKQLNALIKSLPQGIDPVAALQVFLLTILNK